MSVEQVAVYMTTLGQQARKASRVIARAPTAVKNAALLATAEAIEAATEQLVAANQLDLQAGRDNGLDDAMLDRLALTSVHENAIARIYGDSGEEVLQVCPSLIANPNPNPDSKTSSS